VRTFSVLFTVYNCHTQLHWETRTLDGTVSSCRRRTDAVVAIATRWRDAESSVVCREFPAKGAPALCPRPQQAPPLLRHIKELLIYYYFRLTTVFLQKPGPASSTLDLPLPPVPED